MSALQPIHTDPVLIGDVLQFLAWLAPLELAEAWDNVGLLWGDASSTVSRVMTCLTLTGDVGEEAVQRGAGLIVSHHPILFHPVQRLTAETSQGRLLLDLAKNGIAVYSAHTAYDNTTEGINRQLADQLGLETVSPLRRRTLVAAAEPSPSAVFGVGRYGRLSPPRSLAELAKHVKARLGLPQIEYVGHPETQIERLAIACGAGADFLRDAIEQRCEALLTGEARFHACLEARESGLALILVGHFASERPAMRQLAEQIGRHFPALEVWASTIETDPLQRG